VLLVLVPTGCGSGHHAAKTQVVTRTATPYDAAVCLDTDTFLVNADGSRVTGSSPGGINFVATFYRSPAAAAAAFAHHDPEYATRMAAAVIDYSGNPPLHPGGKPMRLTYDELATLRHCIELHSPG
jgi:hypothetical protein